MGQKYSNEVLHPIRYMQEHMAEVERGDLCLERAEYLKKQFAKVNALAYEIYKDTYILLIKLDREMMQSPEQLWKHELQSRLFYTANKLEKYSRENLHPIRHFEEYTEEIENEDLTEERIIELKKRLAMVRTLAIDLFFEAKRLITLLD